MASLDPAVKPQEARGISGIAGIRVVLRGIYPCMLTGGALPIYVSTSKHLAARVLWLDHRIQNGLTGSCGQAAGNGRGQK